MNQTIEYYNKNTESFVSTTKDVEFSETQDLFITTLQDNFPSQKLNILDFGCGSGRDTKYFREHGLSVDAIDGSSELCRFASEYTGIKVEQVLFQDWKPKQLYNGIWACSSILHLNKEDLIQVLATLWSALEPKGILYTSFKYGTFEGIRNGRYFIDFTEQTIKTLFAQLGHFKQTKMWITSDVRPGRSDEKWLNLLLSK